ncbi:hypothetical protein EDD11_005058 [Mortierella claussenii]|nr:hypothetical protein EDD11_005058 [Mortierella claussenii]
MAHFLFLRIAPHYGYQYMYMYINQQDHSNLISQGFSLLLAVVLSHDARQQQQPIETEEQAKEYFSTNPNADRIKQVQGEIEQVKDVMVHNIERVLERGERIELLVDKTDNLNQQAYAFKKRSAVLRRAMWWKNTKLMIILTGVIIDESIRDFSWTM